MPIYITRGLWLSGELLDEGINANNPRIGYHNVITLSSATADDEDPLHPVSNLTNVSTAEYHLPTTDAEYNIYFEMSPVTCNYFAIGAHTLAGSEYQFYYREDDADPWTALADERIPGDNNAIIQMFENVLAPQWRIRVAPAAGVLPRIGIVYLGQILALQRRVYVGHTPIVDGISTEVLTGKSENANFLGRVVVSETLSSSIQQQNVTPSFFREKIRPFIVHAKTKPYFVAWRPGAYPLEVGLCWSTSDIVMKNQLPNGMVEFDISYNAIAPLANTPDIYEAST